ncbi:type VI secretion system-associated protein TagF [Noviherbaspirillum sp.]|uniref:type VI secretion system-associated protein TagF n=1 Tax=Noviherbaspirillum sp. TaxID=1926288 RepID=UPI002FE011E4
MSNSALASGPVGWFGKLPALGDFVQRNLPDHFVPAWDTWLQAGMAAASRQQGEEWKDAFLCFPVWYFLRRVPGDASPESASSVWTGMFLPSADRVGRLYPLTVAFPVPADMFLQLDFVLLEARLEEIETLVLNVLASDDLAGFERALAALAPMHVDPAVKALHTVAPAALMKRLGAQALLDELHGSTLFWAPDAGPLEPLLLAAEPLQADTFCKLVTPLTTSLLAH